MEHQFVVCTPVCMYFVHMYVCTHNQETVHSVEWPQKPLSLEHGYNNNTSDSWPKWPAECSALNAFVESSYARPLRLKLKSSA